MPFISGGGGGGSQVFTLATKTVTSAQLLAIGSTVVTLIAAPGASLILWPVFAYLRYTKVGSDYTGTPDLEIGLGGVGTAFVDAAILEVAPVSFTGDSAMAFYAIGSSAAPHELNPSLLSNVPLTMDNSGNALTVGGGNLSVSVGYVVLPA